jgi:type II secretory pathway component GspD/PulD (secretin)
VPTQSEAEKADQAEAAFQKGLAAYQDGQLDVAVQWWNYALTLVPNHPRALQYLQQTRPEYDAWVQKQQANAIELQKEASVNAKLDTPITFDTAGPKSLTEFLSALSLISDMSFYVENGVDPDLRITAKFEDVPLRDALDTTLLPIGLKWSQSGDVIAVTPDLKTKFFNLTPDQVARLKTLLENKTLQKILYGPEGVPPVKNVELLLDDRENVLLVTDSQENINKVEAFLKDMQQAGPPALIYKSWKIRPEEGPKIKALVEAIVRVQSDAPYDLERKVVVDGSDLIVKDTPENIKKIEELLLDKNFIKKIENQQLQVATFNLTPREPLSDNIEQVREMAQNIVTVVKTLLYAKSSESAAAAEGRRYWYDPNTLQLTIVDYPDNLRVVSDYIRSLPTLGKKQKSEIIFLKHQTATDMSDLISRVLGLTTQEPTAGGAGRAGGNQITRTVSVSGGTPQEIVFRDLRMRASKINENDANDRNDDSVELIINTPTTSEERTIDEYKSEFVDDYEISVLEVRPSGTAGQGTAKIQVRYNPVATGVAGGGAGGTIPGLAPGAIPGQATPTPAPAAETGLTVETIDNMNALLIRYDDPADFAEIKSYIEQLDIPVLQVSIETKLVEVNETKAKEYMPQFSILNLGKQGVDFDNSSLNMRYAQDIDEYRSIFDPFVEGPGSAGLLKGTTVLNFISPGETPVAFTLRMLEAEGVVNVVNGPMITVENGETADFQIEQRLGVAPFGSNLGGGATTGGGTTTPGGTTGGTTGGGTTPGGTTTGGTTTNQASTFGGGYSVPTVTMSVSPKITQLGEIRLEISNLELYDVGGVGGYITNQTDASGNVTGRGIATDPLSFDLRRRYLTTTARVTDGGTIVLGGWTGERSRKSESGVPILRNLPYVGKLFFNRTSNVTDKTTLLVFLTCHLQKP